MFLVTGILRSDSCTGYVEQEDDDHPRQCKNCILIKLDKEELAEHLLNRMGRRAYTESLHTTSIKNEFLTIKQLSQRSEWHTARQKAATLAWLNSQRGRNRLLQRLSGHKKVLVLMAAKREPRYHQVVSH